jgi:hypothetical protein
MRLIKFLLAWRECVFPLTEWSEVILGWMGAKRLRNFCLHPWINSWTTSNSNKALLLVLYFAHIGAEQLGDRDEYWRFITGQYSMTICAWKVVHIVPG